MMKTIHDLRRLVKLKEEEIKILNDQIKDRQNYIFMQLVNDKNDITIRLFHISNKNSLISNGWKEIRKEEIMHLIDYYI